MEKSSDSNNQQPTAGADAFMQRMNDTSSMRIKVNDSWVWLVDNKEDRRKTVETDEAPNSK